MSKHLALVLLYALFTPSTRSEDRLIIPSIGLAVGIGTGVYLKELETRVALWSWTEEPGHIGNTVIGGHRTIGPGHFIDLNELHKGDEIQVSWNGELLLYTVVRKFILTRPHQSGVIDKEAEKTDLLTLVTCHPKYHDEQRLVIRAERR